ncbi:hypothetical protein PIB30_038220 [Stylosanthes scabra]|uniref:Aminotransferase class I/classII large domain-containing protein n=1 Tax=Stylosanthes scabra TaxID=79078 RepID=A0ABU6TE63_9FABA|nr:hypothetical protein [Stylosanthes scabra]
MITGNNVWSQAAIPEILERTKDEFYSKNLDILRETANIFYEKVKEIPSLTCPHKPEGAMAVMVQINLSQIEGIIDDVDFCVKLAKEESVLILPGVTVGLKNWLRISFGVERSALEEGLSRLKAFCLRHARSNHGTEIPSTLASPSSQAWLDGLSSPGFQQMIEQILMSGVGDYRSEFEDTQYDGTQFESSQVHLDLNELVSSLSQVFMALGGTPPLAHMPGPSWKMPFMDPAFVSTPPASPTLAEHPDQSLACGRGHRVPRHRGCGVGGHI